MSDDVPGLAGGLLAEFVPGSRLAGYVLEQRIGAGGMAVVFLAWDERLRRRVALKILSPALASDAGFRQRFIRESRSAAAVDDPHIIPVHEAGEAGSVLYIAMRYVASGDAGSVLHRVGPLAPERVAAIISPVAAALDAAHAAGLVHRDVKPGNMLIDSRPGRPDHVFLSDFGLSKGGLSAGPTLAGQVLGTPNYMAPEQIEGRAADGRADQYALACSAFELLTGVVPFERDEGMAVLWAHLGQQPPPVSSKRPGLEAADPVFAKALAKKPEDRYASCGEFADALRHTLGLAPYDTSPREMPAIVPQPTQLTEPAEPAEQVAAASMVTEAAAQQASDGHATPTPPRIPSPPVNSQVGAEDETLSRMPTTAVTVESAGGPSEISPRNRRKWLRPTIATAGVMAVVLAIVLIVALRGNPPVLRPTGLLTSSLTSTSVAFTWSGPSSGPIPDHYLILEDGLTIASVRGTIRSYSIQGLNPGQSYSYQIIAVRGGIRSPGSDPLPITTPLPPFSDARLEGSWTVQTTVASNTYPSKTVFNHVGAKWTDTWTFVPTCTTGPCSADLTGTIDGTDFSMTLTRSGATYTGVTSVSHWSYCESSGKPPISATLRLRLRVTSAAGPAFDATTWVGSITGQDSSAGPCTAGTWKANFSAAA